MASDPGGGPTGGNPYLPYLQQVEDAVYLRPPSEFADRLVALSVLTSIAGAAAVAHFALLLIDIHRRGWRNNFWIFRLVPRPSGRMICTNSKLTSCLMSLTCIVVQICYMADVRKTIIDRGSQRLSVAYRCYSASVDVSHLWLLSWAQLQAYLAGLKGREGERDLISARWLNAAFVGLGMGLWFTTMAAAAHATTIAARWIGSFEVLDNHLHKAAAAWTPASLPTADDLLLQEQASRFVSLGVRNTNGTIFAYGVTTTIVAVLIVVNAVSLSVVYVVKRRRGSERGLDQELIVAHDLTLNPISTTASSTHGSKNEYKMTTNEIRTLAAQRHTMAGLQAAQLLEARKNERDLIKMASWCGAIALFGFGLGIWVTGPLLRGGQWQDWTNRPLHEAALTLLQWLYASLLVGLYPSLILAAWRNLSPRTMSCRLASKVDFSLHSPFHRRPNSISSSRSAPRAGAAPAGRVRVVVEKKTRDEYRHDLPLLETSIVGGFVPVDATDIPATGAPRGGEGLGVAWVKPSWAVGGGEEGGSGSPAPPEPTLGKRSSKASSLRWQLDPRTPVESTAAQEVTPWAWRNPSK